MSRSDYDDMPTSFNRSSRRKRGGGGRKSYIFALMGVLIILIIVIVLMVFNGEPSEEPEERRDPTRSVSVSEVEEVDVLVPEAPMVTEPVETADPVETPEPVIEAESGPSPVTEETPAEEEETLPETPVTEESLETSVDEGPFRRYVVAEGDSLSSIAQSFMLDPGTLASVNRIQDQTGIRAGLELVIPPTDGTLYQVRSSDTAESIMKRFGITDMTKEELLSLNGAEESLEGQEWLFIPQKAEEALSPFIRPTDAMIDKVFGETWKDEVLQGVTFSMMPGDAVRAIADGIVTDAGTDRNYGRFITVMHDDFYKSTYYCLEMTNVRLGQTVSQGDVIATVGTSCRYFGESTLYFKLEQGPVKLDPMLFF